MKIIGYNDRVQQYIDNAAPFAISILYHLQKLVHTACPTVEESIKWSFPNFNYNGSILCSMAAFKHHCSFGFWLTPPMSDPHNILATAGEKEGMGNFGQIKQLADLPSDNIIISYTKEAMVLIDKGVKLPRVNKKVELPEIPAIFNEALKQNGMANQHFEAFSPSQKKEYLQWISEAKTDATKAKRTNVAIEWLQEGKTLNWKYERH